MALLGAVVVHRDGERLRSPHQYHQPFSSGYGGVDQVALQQKVVLGGNGHHHSRVLGTLGLVNRNGIGQNDFVHIGGLVS